MRAPLLRRPASSGGDGRRDLGASGGTASTSPTGRSASISSAGTANGPDGYLTLWKAPGSTAQVVNLPNGKSWAAPGSTDSGGVLWGGAEYEGDWGWFRVSETGGGARLPLLRGGSWG